VTQSGSTHLSGIPVRVRDTVVARPLREEMVLLDLDSGIYYSLNSLGALIWSHLVRGATPAAIIAAITAEYDVQPEAAAAALQARVAEPRGRSPVTASR